eukprot:gene11204-29314_t
MRVDQGLTLDLVVRGGDITKRGISASTSVMAIDLPVVSIRKDEPRTAPPTGQRASSEESAVDLPATEPSVSNAVPDSGD